MLLGKDGKVELRDVSGHVVMDGKNPVQEDRITYKFVKQAFRKAYLAAWKKYAEDNEGEEVRPQFLVIDIVFPVLWSQFFAVRVAFFCGACRKFLQRRWRFFATCIAFFAEGREKNRSYLAFCQQRYER